MSTHRISPFAFELHDPESGVPLAYAVLKSDDLWHIHLGAFTPGVFDEDFDGVDVTLDTSDLGTVHQALGMAATLLQDYEDQQRQLHRDFRERLASIPESLAYTEGGRDNGGAPWAQPPSRANTVDPTPDLSGFVDQQ